MSIIQHDVKRLDRLISDISDASRLDAELARADAEPVDMARLLEAVVVGRQRAPRGARPASPHGRAAPAGRDAFLGPRPRQPPRPGHQQPDRQRPLVLAAGRTVRVTPAARARTIEIVVEDDGPGIEPARPRPDLRALLHRPAGAGLRPEFGPRPVDLAPDHRGPSRHDPGREPARPPDEDGEPTRLGARFVIRLPGRQPDGGRRLPGSAIAEGS